ncbi:MAG: UxaA family hydrolase, partial [Spirochaetales bacterium]
MIENKKSSPLFIKVNPADNVAIVVNEGGLPAGSAFADGLVLLEAVPQGHKVALSDIDSGAAVVRYGEIIGHATRRLP